MPDYRIIGRLAETGAPLPADDDWTNRWRERTDAILNVFGETADGGVHAFSWKNHILPGACALTFKPTSKDNVYSYLTLGLTQSVDVHDTPYPWEFSIRTQEHVEWAVDLLYQLLSQWLSEKGNVWFGYHLPLRFFTGHDGKLWASISERIRHQHVVGSMRGLYLWADNRNLHFTTPSGKFGLLAVVAVTEDEDRLADETTPAHLMLLLRRMRVTQICNPYRSSVLRLPNAGAEWSRIRTLSHDDAFNELQMMA